MKIIKRFLFPEYTLKDVCLIKRSDNDFVLYLTLTYEGVFKLKIKGVYLKECFPGSDDYIKVFKSEEDALARKVELIKKVGCRYYV